MESRSKIKPNFRALYGLGCLTLASIVRSEKFIGGKIGIVPVHDIKYALRLKNEGTEEILKNILQLDPQS